jgi:hypothetical protein
MMRLKESNTLVILIESSAGGSGCAARELFDGNGGGEISSGGHCAQTVETQHKQSNGNGLKVRS